MFLPRGVALHMTGYAPACTKSVQKGSFWTYNVIDVFCKKGILFTAYPTLGVPESRARISRALRRLGLKTGTENSALKMFLCGALIVYLVARVHRKLHRNHRISIAMESYGWACAAARAVVLFFINSFVMFTVKNIEVFIKSMM